MMPKQRGQTTNGARFRHRQKQERERLFCSRRWPLYKLSPLPSSYGLRTHPSPDRRRRPQFCLLLLLPLFPLPFLPAQKGETTTTTTKGELFFVAALWMVGGRFLSLKPLLFTERRRRRGAEKTHKILTFPLSSREESTSTKRVFTVCSSSDASRARIPHERAQSEPYLE